MDELLQFPKPQEKPPLPSDEVRNLDRVTQSEKFLHFLDATHANEVFDSAEHKVDFVRSMTYEEFTNLLIRTNGVLRDIPANERQIFQPVGMATASEWSNFYGVEVTDFPRMADKPDLLRYAFETIQRLEDPRDMALILGMAITSIHVFGDGNGRTSRMGFDLLNYNFTGSDQEKDFLQKALSEDGRVMTPDCNPVEALYSVAGQLLAENGFTQHTGKPMNFYEPLTTMNIAEYTDLSDAAREKLLFLKDRKSYDARLVDLAMGRVFSQTAQWQESINYIPASIDVPEHFSDSMRELAMRDRCALSEKKLFSTATEEQIDHCYVEYWNAKAEVVRELIDRLAAPTDGDSKELSFRESVRHEIYSDLDRNKANYSDLAEIWPVYPNESIPQINNHI